jgi:hypothetical protein
MGSLHERRRRKRRKKNLSFSASELALPSSLFSLDFFFKPPP